MNLCKLVKEELDYDAVFCLKPNTCEGGLTQACHAVDYHSVEYYLDFWERKYGIQLYVNHSNHTIRITCDNTQRSFDCLTTQTFAKFLYSCNKEALMVFLHSLFCRTIRLTHNTAAAADTAATAAYAAADAAAAADVAAYAAAYAATRAAAGTVTRAAADTAEAAEAAAYAAYAAGIAAATAAYAAAYAAARAAFGKLIVLRKILLRPEGLK